jgi:hypothetical protein
MDYTFTYKPIAPPSPAAPAPAAPAATAAARWDPRAPTYASQDGRVASLSSSECVFLVKGDDTPHVMTMQVLQALDQCREFRTLDDHVVRIEANVTGLAGKRDAIQRVVDNLVQRGLLLRDEDFLTRLRSTPRRETRPLRAIYIRACDRPERLAGLLSSLADYEQRHRARRRYVLIDDSAQADNAHAQRDLLRGFARTTGCEVTFVGPSESAQLAQRLAQACPQARDTVATLLSRDAHAQGRRFGGGRSRNVALLLSAGARLVLLDDDLRLPLRRPDFARDGLDPNPDATAYARFHEGMEQALAGGSEIEEDPFELHLDVCGQPLGACISGRYDLRREALRGLSLSQLELLDPQARIVSSQHGSCGSSRSESTLWLYHALDRVGREELWQDRESYRRNSTAHYLFYAVSKARVIDLPGFTPFALDNSELLPCTNPVGRAEDSFGSALTRYCRPDAIALELPVAIGHVQESLRARFPITSEAHLPRVNDFLREFTKRQLGASAATTLGAACARDARSGGCQRQRSNRSLARISALRPGRHRRPPAAPARGDARRTRLLAVRRPRHRADQRKAPARGRRRAAAGGVVAGHRCGGLRGRAQRGARRDGRRVRALACAVALRGGRAGEVVGGAGLKGNRGRRASPTSRHPQERSAFLTPRPTQTRARTRQPMRRRS